MSVYSGFATRQQEKKYNQYLECVMSMLTKRLYRFYMGESCNQAKFKHLLISIHDKMQQMEESKYLEPHFSYIIRDFLKSTAQVFDQVGQLSRMKEEDPFNQTFSKLSDSHIKVKFNTINTHQNQQDETELEHKINHHSRKTLNQRRINFKTRVKTVTPEYQSNQTYFTPQKRSSFGKSVDISKDRNQKEALINMVEHSKPRNQLAEIQKREYPTKGRAMSPRQFLRQTVKGKDTFSHLALRTKQKHQKVVKI